ncbi:hypothetical protein FOZ63_033466, partial [Perkinsus olseni]
PNAFELQDPKILGFDDYCIKMKLSWDGILRKYRTCVMRGEFLRGYLIESDIALRSRQAPPLGKFQRFKVGYYGSATTLILKSTAQRLSTESLSNLSHIARSSAGLEEIQRVLLLAAFPYKYSL